MEVISFPFGSKYAYHFFNSKILIWLTLLINRIYVIPEYLQVHIFFKIHYILMNIKKQIKEILVIFAEKQNWGKNTEVRFSDFKVLKISVEVFFHLDKLELIALFGNRWSQKFHTK